VRRLLVLAAVLVGAVVVQSAVLAGVRLGGVRPDLLVLAVVAVAMASDATTGAVFGFVTGLVADLLFDLPVGCRRWSTPPSGSPSARSGCT
jgi:rod shape-determining protein MreD